MAYEQQSDAYRCRPTPRDRDRWHVHCCVHPSRSSTAWRRTSRRSTSSLPQTISGNS